MNHPPMFDNIVGQPASHRGIIELYEGPHHQALVACAERLRQCDGNIIVSGMGASFFAALPAVSRLQQHGYRVQAIDSAELLHYGCSTLRSRDVGVLISRSGGSFEVVRLAEKMRAIGMFVIAVTNVPASELERCCDLHLLIGARADQLIAVQTYTGTVLALLLLAEQVLAGESARLSSACVSMLPAMDAYIHHALRLSDSENDSESGLWKNLFEGAGPLYLLGRGPALASVHEGALLLHETAKAPAVGMSSGQFRHGPVEVVSRDFRAVIFGSPGKTQALDRSLARDLTAMGAQVGWVGPADESDTIPPLVAWPDFGPALLYASLLAPLFEIIPLQVAAIRLALWRGLTPGHFRYASEVTAQEAGFPLFDADASRT